MSINVKYPWSGVAFSSRHLPGKHNQKDHASGGSIKGNTGRMTLNKTERVWTGKQHPYPEKKLSKLQVGEIGEKLAMNVLSQKMGVPYKTLNEGVNNAPIDVAGNHTAVEVKAGLATNGRTAQHWRLTIGEPGKAEKELLKKMTREEKRAHNRYKTEQIIARKKAVVEQMSKEAGAPIRELTVAVIVSPDGKKADVYQFDGFHASLPWKQYATDEYLVGSYETGF